MAGPEAPAGHKPDPQYRQQDHLIFAALAIPIFVVTFFIIALIVTIGLR